MHGVLNFLKPPGMTSHDAVAFVRRVLKTKRVGHTGTLDPAACGVLPICVGQATRLVENLQTGTKEYLAEATFGYETDTLDQCGQTIRECDASSLDLDTLRAALDKFRGEIEQTPPMYSAIKIDGKKLYELAREGQEVEVPTRKVTISKLLLERWIDGEQPKAFLRIECSGGTYIRSLVRDIAAELGLAATMTFLVRTRSGRFGMEEAVTPEQFAASPVLTSIENLLEGLTVVSVEDNERTHSLWQGKQVPFSLGSLYLPGRIEREEKNALAERRNMSIKIMQCGPALFHNTEKTLFVLATKADADEGYYKPEKVFDLREK